MAHSVKPVAVESLQRSVANLKIKKMVKKENFFGKTVFGFSDMRFLRVSAHLRVFHPSKERSCNGGPLQILSSSTKCAEMRVLWKGPVSSGFWKTIRRASRTEKIMKIVWADLQISSLLGFGHARAAFGQTPFSRVWYIVVTWYCILWE